ncbi:hypothetical protein [Lactiplantibacillus plantarum]
MASRHWRGRFNQLLVGHITAVIRKAALASGRSLMQSGQFVSAEIVRVKRGQFAGYLVDTDLEGSLATVNPNLNHDPNKRE